MEKLKKNTIRVIICDKSGTFSVQSETKIEYKNIIKNLKDYFLLSNEIQNRK